RFYALPEDRVEVPVHGFVIDLVRGGLLVEIQTGGFSSLRRKVTSLLELGHRVRVVRPIPIVKWLVKVDANGTVLSRRRSPRHGKPTDIFSDLTSLPDLLAHPHFEVDVLLTIEEELRAHMPGLAWRRNGWTVIERRLVEVVGSELLENGHDLAGLLPEGLPETFTTADLAERLGGPRRTAQQMAYCLRRIGVLVVVGKRGASIEYRVG
ncbi:MAG TPA: hypothetical protein VHM29_04745, partial [Acidimicrobiia bacterium]|nr:hypothetical protein [Acidimicrobiia bacterium]